MKTNSIAAHLGRDRKILMSARPLQIEKNRERFNTDIRNAKKLRVARRVRHQGGFESSLLRMLVRPTCTHVTRAVCA